VGLEKERRCTTVTPILKIKPGVQLAGIKPEMCVVLDIVPTVFARHGYDCWLTCAVEPREEGKHPYGQALDFDSSTNIPESVGREIQTMTKAFLGPGFGVIWHGPRWHLHVQCPPPGA
jgi:hypothetical protein